MPLNSQKNGAIADKSNGTSVLQPKSGVAQPRRKCGARGAQRPTEARSTSGFRNNQFNAFVLKIDLAEFLLYKMKRLRPSAISRSLLSAIVLLLAVWTAVAQNTGQFSLNESPLPAPTGYVNDYAGVIDAATKQQLETKIDNFKKSSNPSTELAVAVVRTTGNRDIFDYSLAIARGWKIGSKEEDNPSLLLFVAIDDRKYYTQVSRDLEDELPDSLVGSLQRQYLVPPFKQGNYAKGISDTIDAYIKTITDRRNGVAPAATATPAPVAGTRGTGIGGGSLCCLMIVGFIILMIIMRGAGRGGGGLGGALPWIIGSAILNSGRGGGSSWGGDGGSSWGGGGGGFGGFGGGGDFGGGGAGGSW